MKLKRPTLLMIWFFISTSAWGAIPEFSGVSLTGQKVSREDLVGKPGILILTPSREASDETKSWVKEIERQMPNVHARDIIALDLPFFISENDAADRAKKLVPKKYWSRTWILDGRAVEKALNLPPEASEAFVFAISSSGEIIDRVSGRPTPDKVEKIRNTLLSATPFSGRASDSNQ